MSAPDYGTQVAELLGKHRVRGFSHRDECACGWQIPDRAGWADRRSHDAHVAEVLAAAGLIPTSTEWGSRLATESPKDPNRVPRFRGVTDWKDAT